MTYVKSLKSYVKLCVDLQGAFGLSNKYVTFFKLIFCKTQPTMYKTSIRLTEYCETLIKGGVNYKFYSRRKQEKSNFILFEKIIKFLNIS